MISHVAHHAVANDCTVEVYLCCDDVSSSCSTAIAIRGKDGVVFGVEKLVTSKLHEPTSNKRIFTIDKHIGVVSQHYDNYCQCSM